jgi:excisionase family DNA binding protein
MNDELIPGSARLLTVRQAAGWLNISVSTVYEWVWQRRIDFVKVGRAVRFDIKEPEKFIEENHCRPKTN